MKLRFSVLTAALLTFSYAAPSSFSQDQSTPSPSASGTSTTTDQSTPSPSTSGASAPTDQSTPSPSASGTSASTDQGTPATTPTVTPADPDKVKHDGGKKDVDAIGNRKMGGRGMGNWYSIESEIRMGKEYAQQVEASVKLVQDPVITEYVNRIGQNLVRNSDAQVPFTIKVIDSDEINAMALPGGFFYVNSGLILAADEEAELAGVMAHEIAHVAARHAMRGMTRSNWANIGTIPLIFVGGGIGYAVRSAAGIGLPLTFLTFSRGFEAEADYLGLQYMYKTGYDPQAFISFFEKVQAQEKKKPGTLAKAFATHPQTPDRISRSQEEISQILPARPEYTVTTSEFDQVKARLAALENRRKIVDEKDSGKPSLRRTSSTDKTSKEDKKDDDRPTLKRRDDNNNN
jgi:beta-barrel assembly-enhancing protease